MLQKNLSNKITQKKASSLDNLTTIQLSLLDDGGEKCPKCQGIARVAENFPKYQRLVCDRCGFFIRWKGKKP